MPLKTQGRRHGGREGSLGGGELGRVGLGVKALVGGPRWWHEGVGHAHGQREYIGQREKRLVRGGPVRGRKRG